MKIETECISLNLRRLIRKILINSNNVLLETKVFEIKNDGTKRYILIIKVCNTNNTKNTNLFIKDKIRILRFVNKIIKDVGQNKKVETVTFGYYSNYLYYLYIKHNTNNIFLILKNMNNGFSFYNTNNTKKTKNTHLITKECFLFCNNYAPEKCWLLLFYGQCQPDATIILLAFLGRFSNKSNWKIQR